MTDQVTKLNITKNLVEKISELLDAEVHYSYMLDHRGEEKRKISNGSQECERMASLLKSLGGEFLEYKLGHHFTQRGFEAEFGEDAEYPQINIGFRHIGNMKETLQHLKAEGAFV